MTHSHDTATPALSVESEYVLVPRKPTDEMIGTAAARDVLAERRRQVEAEGYTAAHDDEHRDGEIARAAAAYAICGALRQVACLDLAKSIWPFEPDGFKHQDERASLVAAGALILAEIERLDRAEARKEGAAR